MDDFLFPPPPDNPNDGRKPSGRSEPTHRWKPLEDAVMWMFLCECASPEDLTWTCCYLCDALGRKPHHTQKTYDRACVDLIENRTVTQHLDADQMPLADWQQVLKRAQNLFNEYRTGLPLTWAEKYRLLSQWRDKPSNERERIPLDNFLVFLGRSHTDAPRVKLWLASLGDAPVDKLTPSDPPAQMFHRDCDQLKVLLRHIAHLGVPTPSEWARFVRGEAT